MIAPRRGGRLAFPVALAAMTLASCRGATSEGGPLPPPSTVLAVTMWEYSFDVSGPLPAGRVVFRVVNEGKEDHAPMLVALDDASPPIDQQVRQSDPLPFTPVGSVNPRKPGHAGAFAIDLEAGHRYALVCRVRAPDRVSHSQKGMTWEARAEAYPPRLSE